jgi:hypothetical protein
LYGKEIQPEVTMVVDMPLRPQTKPGRHPSAAVTGSFTEAMNGRFSIPIKDGFLTGNLNRYNSEIFTRIITTDFTDTPQTYHFLNEWYQRPKGNKEDCSETDRLVTRDKSDDWMNQGSLPIFKYKYNYLGTEKETLD